MFLLGDQSKKSAMRSPIITVFVVVVVVIGGVDATLGAVIAGFGLGLAPPGQAADEAADLRRNWLGSGTERRRTSSASHRADRRARCETIGSGICT